MKLQKESKIRYRTVLHPFAWQNDLLFFLKLLEVLFLWICIPDLVNFCPTPSKNPTGTPGREEEAQEERQKEGQLELAQSCSDGEFPGANLSSGGMVHKI